MKIPAAGARMPEPRAALGRPVPGNPPRAAATPFLLTRNPGSVPWPGAEGRGAHNRTIWVQPPLEQRSRQQYRFGDMRG
jgi:hypothetical protein